MKRSKVPPAGVVVERIEMVVDGGRTVGYWGEPEIDLVLPGDSLGVSRIMVPKTVFPMLPIGARVVLQLERLPDPPKPTSKKRSRR